MYELSVMKNSYFQLSLQAERQLIYLLDSASAITGYFSAGHVFHHDQLNLLKSVVLLLG